MDSKQWARVSDNYQDEILSPIKDSEQNPFLDDLNSIKKKNQKTIAEFGCGHLYLADILSKFKSVHVSDFSKEMIKKAKLNNKYKNITIKLEDITKIKYKEKFDIVLSINSIIMPSIIEIKKSIKNLYNSIKKQGTLMLIVPSMESILFHGFLILNQEISRNSKDPIQEAKKRFEKDKYDLFLGHYNDNGDVQKFYYEHEIEYLLENQGFSSIEIRKVYYPWNSHDYDSFPKEEKIYDLYIKATKF